MCELCRCGIPEDVQDWPIIAGDFPTLVKPDKFEATEVAELLLKMLRKGVGE